MHRTQRVEGEVDPLHVGGGPHVRVERSLRHALAVVGPPVGAIDHWDISGLDEEDEAIVSSELLHVAKIRVLLCRNLLRLHRNLGGGRNVRKQSIGGDDLGHDAEVRLVGVGSALLFQVHLEADVLAGYRQSRLARLVARLHLVIGDHAVDQDLRQGIDQNHHDHAPRGVE